MNKVSVDRFSRLSCLLLLNIPKDSLLVAEEAASKGNPLKTILLIAGSVIVVGVIVMLAYLGPLLSFLWKGDSIFTK